MWSRSSSSQRLSRVVQSSGSSPWWNGVSWAEVVDPEQGAGWSDLKRPLCTPQCGFLKEQQLLKLTSAEVRFSADFQIKMLPTVTGWERDTVEVGGMAPTPPFENARKTARLTQTWALKCAKLTLTWAFDVPALLSQCSTALPAGFLFACEVRGLLDLLFNWCKKMSSEVVAVWNFAKFWLRNWPNGA